MAKAKESARITRDKAPTATAIAATAVAATASAPPRQATKGPAVSTAPAQNSGPFLPPPQNAPDVANTRAPTAVAVAQAPEKANDAPSNDNSLEKFLAIAGLSKYLSFFRKEDVDLEALLMMSDDDLKGLNLPTGAFSVFFAFSDWSAWSVLYGVSVWTVVSVLAVLTVLNVLTVLILIKR